MSTPVIRFGEFELDAARYELRRRGRTVKLERIPMDLLTFLVEKRGDLATRAEIETRVWGGDTPGDIERSINTAVRKIRQALGDNAERPRFVETVVGKGYRFVAAVTEPEPEPVAPTPETIERARKFPVWTLASLGLVLAAVVMASVSFRNPSPAANTPAMRVRPFTALPGSEAGPAFSPDGTQVVFSWATEDGNQQHLYRKAVAGGAEIQLTAAAEHDSNPAWSPDGRTIAFVREDAAHKMAVYLTSAAGGGDHKVQNLARPRWTEIAWPLDGRGVVVADGEPSSIFLLSLESGGRRKLTSPPPSSVGDSHPAFSPDGRILAFLRNTGSLQTGAIHLLPVDEHGLPQSEPRVIDTDRRDLMALDWSADGRWLICAAQGGLVRIPVEGGTAEPLPFQNASDAVVARHGQRLAYTVAVEQTAIYRVPGPGSEGGTSKLIASSRFSGAAQYSPDGTRIAFMSDRTGVDELWLANGDGQHASQLTSFGRATLGSPRWSPDGKRIAFDSTASGPANVYTVSAGGGPPRQVTRGGSSNVRPAWSHDAKSIYFGSDRSGTWEIWKADAEGAGLLQVTHGGGREAEEDPEGRFLYYTKQRPSSGIWRVPVAGGAEEQVSEQGNQGMWEIGSRGLYFLNSQGELDFLDLASRKRQPVAMGGMRSRAGLGRLIGLAPLDRWILVTVPVRSESDLSLVENFR